ncbi:hypothetical protein DFH07DRAFT_100799 [Mycena maculata]|uniref:Uncharacterized protein n=1 Tax=Mycena maculata TaxID=230809 RepID=A0AAD7K2H4_9AGAR|nr:hypothetical protein DFH07DRAFT_100799 [Mycena maculata]
MSQNVTYDDRDPILDYSGDWFRTGTWNATSVDETGTLASSSVTSGVNVTFVFPTPATAFYYFGIPRCCGGEYLICIDCDPNNPQYITIDGVNTSDNGQNPPIVLFSKTFDVPGVHEVILANEPDLRFGGNSQITLDKFELTVPDADAVTTTTATPLSSSAPLSTGATLPVAGSSSSSSSPLAPILGGVLGGLVLLLIILGIWFLLRRRSRRPAYNAEQAPDHQEQHLWQNTSRFTVSTNPATMFSTTTSAPSRRELDAGRIDDYSSPDDTLPPEYGQVFSPADSAPPLPGPSSNEMPRALSKSRR